MSAKASQFEIHLKGNEESPIVNPAFCVKNWNASGAKILVNGKPYRNYKAGINRTLAGTDLVAFVNISTVVPVNMDIVPAD